MAWLNWLSTFTDLATFIVALLLGAAIETTWFADSAYEPVKYAIMSFTSAWLLLMLVDSILSWGCCCLCTWFDWIVKGLLAVSASPLSRAATAPLNAG